ncbi:hypothetical protein P3X46_016738 [Hevea brasiliensis]|uniref:ARID domain-containing protein n=1 Tax=Hevea brasiliensis TaxID=3981 RepID=A0ABQ9M297_HEVBR|nr:AT-rich interactive domain-containing protein 2 [Hevea brasiliensis]XP_058009659.1 AT-rich interactive domain-containing protein 2 [Hevea brasiliensis]KAJ9173621.1 hypothetical protein P3X46_016738 [Hevea brasiliensis]KAJ9173622.1 hypothetical protein P3X46_016738 [Hevea brasiliensis]
MAGWSMLANGSSLDCADIINGYKGDVCCSDANHDVKDRNAVHETDDDYEVKLRCLFDKVLSVFSNEAAARGCIRPIPALLADGQSLDLFKLFQVVRKRGGFDLVNGFWTFVVKELGLDIGVSTSVKLVYFKYLYDLERWLRGGFRDGRLGNGQCHSDGNFSCISMELETEFRSLLSQGYPNGKNVKHKKNGKNIHVDVLKCKKGLLDTKDVLKVCNGVGNKHTDDGNFPDYKEIHSNNDDDGVVILDPAIGNNFFYSRKRKRESLPTMLNWVTQIAKCPDDPSNGVRSSLSKLKDFKGSELWVQAVRARDALLHKRHFDSNSERTLLQNNHKMHPSMYEDVTSSSDQSAEKLRCSERLPTSVKSRLCSCCNSCAAQSQLISPPKTEFEDGLKEQPLVDDDLSAVKTTLSPSGDEQIQRHVLVGPRFQAEVPKWTGIVSESDPRWLGTQVWPFNGDHNAPVETDSIGKGRPDFCGCQLQGSVECVRFHIAENRMKLKLELGLVFYRWRFDHMGEEISLRWTAEEEIRFKNMVRLNPPSLDKCFWDDSRKYFPRKKREELVSYYFNVFLVQRRSYQNRVTPKHIDSDDDESEFGSLSDRYGHGAVQVPGSNMLMCSENKQSSEFK